MIAVIILGVVIGLLLILLLLPVTLDLKFDSELILKIKYMGITLFDTQKRVTVKKSKKQKAKSTPQEDTSAKKDGFIKKTYKQKGLLGTISYFSDLLAIVIKKLWWAVKRLKFRRFKLDIIIATADAANTAMQYGKICAAVYPITALLQSANDFKAKNINISADFDKTQSQFKTSILVKAQLIYLLITAIGILVQFLKLQRKEREKYERKQH